MPIKILSDSDSDQLTMAFNILSSNDSDQCLYWFLGEDFSYPPLLDVFAGMIQQLQSSDNKFQFKEITLIPSNDLYNDLIDIAQQIKSDDVVLSSCTGGANALKVFNEIDPNLLTEIRYLVFYSPNAFLNQIPETLPTCCIIPKSERDNFVENDLPNVTNLIFDNQSFIQGTNLPINPVHPYALAQGSLQIESDTSDYEHLGDNIYLRRNIVLSDNDGQGHQIGDVITDSQGQIAFNLTFMSTVLNAFSLENNNQVIQEIIEELQGNALSLTQYRKAPNQTNNNLPYSTANNQWGFWAPSEQADNSNNDYESTQSYWDSNSPDNFR